VSIDLVMPVGIDFEFLYFSGVCRSMVMAMARKSPENPENFRNPESDFWIRNPEKYGHLNNFADQNFTFWNFPIFSGGFWRFLGKFKFQ